MNKSILIILAIVFSMFVCRKNELPQYEFLKTTDMIRVDGNINEPFWQKANLIQFKSNDSGAPIENSLTSTTARGCYDDQNIYFAFQSNDPDIWCNFTQRDEYLWKEEVVEIFIDTDEDPNNYVEIEISPSNVLFDSYIVNPQKIDFAETAKFNLKGIKTAVTVDGTLNKRDDLDRSWTVEISIPFSDLIQDKSFDINKLKKWRINFYRVNRDLGKNDGLYAWSPTFGRFHTPSKFGVGVFK